MFPTTTGSGESVLVTARSAAACTVVGAEAALFAAFGSVSVAVTVAVLVIVPTAAAPDVTTMVMVALAVLLMMPRLQVTVVVPLHEPCEGVVVPKLTPGGNASVTTTFVALLGPLFVTVRV